MKPNILISFSRQPPTKYIAALEAAGCTPGGGYLPKPDPHYDGLLLAGGGDMDPIRYGEPNRDSFLIDRDRDAAELELLDAFAAWGKPILAICRGLQVLNVWAGGTLYQDLGEKTPSHKKSGGDVYHPVDTVRGSALHAIYGSRFVCASAHHQAISKLGDHLAVSCRSQDQVIEGVDHDRLPILAVQFHPERMFPPEASDGGVLFRHFASLFSL